MQGNFTKGLLIGGIVGASVSILMNHDVMKNRTRKKMMRNGKNIFRRSGHIIGDVVDLFR
jgi:predicted small secreted protein